MTRFYWKLSLNGFIGEGVDTRPFVFWGSFSFPRLERLAATLQGVMALKNSSAKAATLANLRVLFPRGFKS